MTNQGFSARAMPEAGDEDEEPAPAEAELIDKEALRIMAQQRAVVLSRMEEVTTEWMDDMTTRVFNEIKRQIAIVEESKPTKSTDMAANARTLAALQHTLTETLRMKRDRAMRGESKDTKKHADPKGKIVRRLDRQAAEGNAGRASGRSD
jgi:hypothetical protein